MKIDAGDVVGLLSGVKAGQITQREARDLLRQWGTGDDTIDDLLAIGAGVAVGIATGSFINSIVDDTIGGIFDDLF